MLGESKKNPYLCTQNVNNEHAHRGIDHPTTLNTMSFISRKSLRLLAILLVLAQGVWAQEINYDVSDESGLRNVLQNNALIRLTNNISLSSTIGISNITVTIDLNGKTLTAASGQRIFQINAGASLTISDSSSEKTGLLTGAGSVADNGACIYNAGTLTMTGGKIYRNECTSGDGGGIYNSGTLTLSGVELEYNSPEGVFNASGGTAVLSNCTIRRTVFWGINNAGGMTLNAVTITNRSYDKAPGLHNSGTLTMNDGLIEYCRAGNGGGVVNSGTMTIQGTTITNNSAEFYGAGIYNYSKAVLTIKDGTTISKNQARLGGGVLNEGSITMTGGVISENTASEDGAGIYNYNKGEFTMSGGSITDNKASTGKGGGIYNNSPDSGDNGINVTGGTIAYNFAAEGGGIYNNSGTTIIAGGNVGEPTRGNWTDGNGGGIYNKAKLSFQSGSIQGNKASDGAGVYNGEGGLALMNGGTIAQNQAFLYGGGICNYATLTLEGGEIKNNLCGQDGGGVWADGSIGSVLYMQGKPEVSGNVKISSPNNLFLKQDAKIRVTGAFTAGADVHFLCEASGLYKITQDFGGEHNPETIAGTVFTDDAAADYGLSINQGEVYRMPLAKNTSYLRDGSQTADAMKLSDVADGSGVSFGSGWFVLDDDKNYTNRITILGDTRLILTNSKTLTASAGIYVPEWSSLTIYAQPSNGAVGYITATGSANNAGIGGDQNQDAGTITVYGGHVTATGGANAAGIGGGGSLSFYKTINIHGGTVTATGGAAGAGIGTGRVDRDETIASDAAGQLDAVPGMYSSHINITGGQVTATGKDGGAGIGSGDDSYFLGEISISGGVVTASVSETNAEYCCSAAGIGSGMNGSCYLFRNPNAEPMERRATIRISDGWVTATGGQYGAAGIGGGSRFNVNPVIDPGTYVGADCPSYYGGGADVFITGGHVEASGGNHGDATHWGDAIGCGGSYNQDNTVLPTRGTLEIYDGAAVQYWEPGSVNSYAKPYNRVEAARDYYKIVIEQCDHNSSSCAYDHLQHSTCSRCFGNKAAHTFDSNGRCTACGLVSLADNASDNAAHITNLTNSTKRDVALVGRTLYKDGSWNTLCLPFSLTAEQLADSPLKGATIKAFSSASFSKGTLTLNFSADRQTIEAGVPYIVKWAAGDHIVYPLFRQVSLTSATASAVTSEFATATSPASITFQGTYDSYATGGEDKSILYLGVSAEGQSELYYPDSEMTIHALRAFFKLNGLEAGGLPEFDVRGFVLNFGDEEDPTSVSLPMAKEADGAWYDLSGRKVNSQFTIHNSQLSRGVYIHNGRKVVVKQIIHN